MAFAGGEPSDADDEGYTYLSFTGMDFYFFGTNYGDSAESIYMNTNNVFGFGTPYCTYGQWPPTSPAILFGFLDCVNFSSYVSPPQNGTLPDVQYVRIVTMGTNFANDREPVQKKCEIYYVRDRGFQYMQFNCFIEDAIGMKRFDYTDNNVSNITDGIAFQDTFGAFGDHPSNTEGPQTGGSYVIKSDLNGENWSQTPI